LKWITAALLSDQFNYCHNPIYYYAFTLSEQWEHR